MRADLLVVALFLAAGACSCSEAGPADHSTGASAEKVTVPDGPVTSNTLLLFVPESLGGGKKQMRQVVDEALAAGAYQTPAGFINVNIALTRSLSFERAAVEGDEQTMVGRFKARRVVYESGSKSELRLFLAERIAVMVSIEGSVPTERLVALAAELDLDGLEALAARIPQPPP
jgi:hypothetical protein